MKTLFVTVGSTKFPELISNILSKDFLSLLCDLQFSSLKIQAGSTPVPPITDTDLDIEVYSYKPTIIDDMKDAFMIISHAGAGSILEALNLNKKLLVVINDSLMDNHQSELANELSPDYLVSSELINIKDNFLKCYHSDQRKEWTAPDYTLLHILREELIL